jgi:ribonuclease E
VAIDVNSGRFVKERDLEETSFRTNLEAAEEIARQLRLRDLGGLIVIDFIAMKQPKHRTQVEKKLRESLKKDKAKITMTKFSKLGLIEIARQKLQAPLQWGSHRPCPYCRGQGQIRTVEVLATGLLRRIKSLLAKKKLTRLRVRVAPDLAAYLLNQKRRDLFALEEYYETSIFIEPGLDLPPEETEFLEEPRYETKEETPGEPEREERTEKKEKKPRARRKTGKKKENKTSSQETLESFWSIPRFLKKGLKTTM